MDKIVSVVIPTYNRKDLTDRAVQSVISKNHELVEIIVVDDGGSVPYFWVNEFNKHKISVKVFRCPENGGAGVARKMGVSKATGKYIAFLDSDDVFCEEWVDFLLNSIRDRNLINKRAILIGKAIGGQFVADLINKYLRFLNEKNRILITRALIIFLNPFYTPSLAMRSDLCKFRIDLRYCEDFYTNMRAVFCAELIVMEDVFACELGRVPNSKGGLSSVKYKMLKGEMSVRADMVATKNINMLYKLGVPFGFLYQITREVIKFCVRSVRQKRE